MSSVIVKRGQVGNVAVSVSVMAGIAEFVIMDEVVVEGNRGFVSIMM